MKKYLKTLFLFMILISAFVACANDSGGSDDSGSSSGANGKYTVTYVDENGKTLKTETYYDNYLYSSTYEYQLKKDGYKITLKDSSSNTLPKSFQLNAANTKITVIYEPITYKIKFDKYTGYYSGTVSGILPDEITCTYDEEYTLPTNNLTYTYYSTVYKARGWTKNKDSWNERGEFVSGDLVKNLSTKDGDVVTLYACFSNDNSWSLKFYTSDSSYSNCTTVCTDDGDIIPASSIPEAGKKTGYKFEGYYLSSDDSQTVIDFTTYSVSGDAAFKPKYSLCTYKATFVTERGTAPKDLTWTYSSDYSYSANTVEKIYIDKGEYVLTATGYNFEGWVKEGNTYTSSYISKHYDTEDLTLTAKWTSWKATLTYDSNAPSNTIIKGSMNYSTIYYETAAKLDANKFSSPYYKFIGWNTKADGTGTSYADNANLTWKGSTDGEAVKLYAQWKKLPVAVTVGIASPSSTSSDIKLSYDSSAKNFKAVLSGASIFEWFIDGVKVEDEAGARLSIYALDEGHHTVMVTTEFGGKKYGDTIVVNVKVNTGN